MKQLRLLLSVLVCAALWSHAPAQTSYWEAGITGGYMMPNNFNMLEYSSSAFGLEAGWWWRNEDSSWWARRRCYPSFGVKASFAYLPNSVAGHRFGVVGVVRGPLWQRLDYHIGLGLSTYTRPQHVTGDPENIFISSIISCLIDVGFVYHFTDYVGVSFSLLHSSNGMLSKPNKGLNFLQLGALVQSKPYLPKQKLNLSVGKPAFDRREAGFAIQLGTVLPRSPELKDVYYLCYDVSLNYQYYLDPVVAVGGTVDVWYNYSNSALNEVRRLSYANSYYVSVLGFVEGFWGPLSIKAGIGPVLLSTPRVSIPFYERVGAYYNFGNNYIGVALNAHAGIIEFIEWTYGRRIKVL